MITKTARACPLDKITRISPIIRAIAVDAWSMCRRADLPVLDAAWPSQMICIGNTSATSATALCMSA
jgi:hypothetical protein